MIHTIGILGSRYGGECCVELGIHLTFLPEAGRNTPPNPRKITVWGCEFRTRLAPAGESEYSWAYGRTEGETEASVRYLVAVYKQVGTRWFDLHGPFPGLFASLTPEQIAKGGYFPLFGWTTRARIALALARVGQYLGQREQTEQWARQGLVWCGDARFIKAEFEEILGIGLEIKPRLVMIQFGRLWDVVEVAAAGPGRFRLLKDPPRGKLPARAGDVIEVERVGEERYRFRQIAERLEERFS